MKTGAQLFVECLVTHGVKIIFGIPGAKIDSVFDALLDSPIKLIVCRHEQNAAFMAAAYGRLTGKPGVVLVTSGPGVSNLATGLLTATTEGDPVIAIGGSVPRNMKLKESHQNTDNIKLMEAVTKARMEVLMVENIPEVIENAFRSATRPRSGAVFISLPQDVLKETTRTIAPIPLPSPHGGYAPDTDIDYAVNILHTATFPVLFLGAEASKPANTAMIRTLLSHHPLPTISTYQAAGAISRDLEKYFIGRVGLFKNQPGDKALEAADVVITVGYNPVEYDPEIWNTSKQKKIIHIDYNPAVAHATYLPAREIIGDIALNIEKILPLLGKSKPYNLPSPVKKAQEALLADIQRGATYSGERIHPLRFIHDLRTVTSDADTVISDIGSHYIWLARYFYVYEPHHLLFSNGQQTLGVALPWAIATRFARPHGAIISISGDGGFLFSATELETAVREKIPLVHCVWCDGTYNMVLEQEIMKYKRESAVRFGSVDIIKFAEAFGAQGFKIQHADELLPTLKKAIGLKAPTLIEVPIDYSDNPNLFKTVHEHVGN
ncbi:MAG: acetolactate synthase [Gammaproteobacteria bacterium RIFCSPHIGHO2_12_FULL_41_20]|nr:MAG: acetolactate synthase [Gammaproteobacteria bacterium RIFCSPHIGHO2_12_FULL_41_20]